MHVVVTSSHLAGRLRVWPRMLLAGRRLASRQFAGPSWELLCLAGSLDGPDCPLRWLDVTFGRWLMGVALPQLGHQSWALLAEPRGSRLALAALSSNVNRPPLARHTREPLINRLARGRLTWLAGRSQAGQLERLRVALSLAGSPAEFLLLLLLLLDLLEMLDLLASGHSNGDEGGEESQTSDCERQSLIILQAR